MYELIASDPMKFLGLPLLNAALTVFVKFASQQRRWNRDHLRVGLDLMVAGIFLLVVLILERSAVLASAPGSAARRLGVHLGENVVLLAAMFLALIGMIDLVRRNGWYAESTARGASTWYGVVVPDVVGVACLIVILARAQP